MTQRHVMNVRGFVSARRHAQQTALHHPAISPCRHSVRNPPPPWNTTISAKRNAPASGPNRLMLVLPPAGWVTRVLGGCLDAIWTHPRDVRTLQLACTDATQVPTMHRSRTRSRCCYRCTVSASTRTLTRHRNQHKLGEGRGRNQPARRTHAHTPTHTHPPTRPPPVLTVRGCRSGRRGRALALAASVRGGFATGRRPRSVSARGHVRMTVALNATRSRQSGNGQFWHAQFPGVRTQLRQRRGPLLSAPLP